MHNPLANGFQEHTQCIKQNIQGQMCELKGVALIIWWLALIIRLSSSMMIPVVQISYSFLSPLNKSV